MEKQTISSVKSDDLTPLPCHICGKTERTFRVYGRFWFCSNRHVRLFEKQIPPAARNAKKLDPACKILYTVVSSCDNAR